MSRTIKRTWYFMKTLQESIVNELKLSNAKTGDKLSDKKKFGELLKGDYLFRGVWNNYCKGLVVDVLTFHKFGTISDKKDMFLDDDIKKKVKADTDIICINANTGGTFRLCAVKDATMISYGINNTDVHYFSNSKVFKEYIDKNNVKLVHYCEYQLKELGII